MADMFNIGDEFGQFTIMRKMSSHHDGEREVYLADDNGEMNVVLTVFDLESKRYAPYVPDGPNPLYPDFIDEVRFLTENSGMGCVPQIMERGIQYFKGHRYAWISQVPVEGESLDSLIRNLGIIDIADAAEITLRIARVIERVAQFTNGGGHYNINPENILVNYVDDELQSRSVHLIGFSNIGPAYQGSHPLNILSLDKRFRTQEADIGIFNVKTDIFALGMLMAAMIAGYPKKIKTDKREIDIADNELDIDEITSLNFYHSFWGIADKVLSRAYQLILHKATAIYPGNRFATVSKLIDMIEKISRSQREFKENFDELTRPKPTPTEQPSATKDEAPEEKEKEEEGKLKKETCTAKTKTGTGTNALDDVAGMEELKNIFRRDFIRILRNKEVARAYGIKPSNCTLLYGPQGCGKTFIAEKAAQEAGLKYKIVNPSDLGSIYLHGSQQKIAGLFEEAEKKAPMILILDEFDALVPTRSEDDSVNQANEVNEMLTQLNNCAERGIYVLATTNRPTLLDPAIMRKGRIDRAVFVSLPDMDARRELFRMETEKRPHSDMDYEALARATEHLTCSDITFIVEESARLCFEDTLEQKLDEPIPLSMERLMEVIRHTPSSVSERQRKEYLELKARMERGSEDSDRKKVGFALNK